MDTNNNVNVNESKIIEFLDLPKEEIQRILTYLTPNELSAVSKTNKLLNRCSLPILWRQFKQYTVVNASEFEQILQKYGKYIKLLTPNSLPGGLHKFNIQNFYNYCPNIEEFYLNLFDFEYFENYSIILNNWKNVKALTVIRDFEFELISIDQSKLEKLNTLKLVNFYTKSSWIDELQIKDNIINLTYEFTNYNFNSTLDFQFNQFSNLKHLILNLNFFSILKFELIDQMLTNIQYLENLHKLEIYSKSYFETTLNGSEFVPFLNITRGFSGLREVILDLYGVLGPDDEEEDDIEDGNSDTRDRDNITLKPFQLSKFFSNLCPNLTLIYISFMDDTIFQSILSNCPNLKKLGTHSTIPLLYEMPAHSLKKLSDLTITDTCRSAFHNQINYRAVFPNLTTLYITGNQLPERYKNHLSCLHKISLIFPKLTRLQINTELSEIPIEILKKSKFDNLEELIVKVDNIYSIKDKLHALVANSTNLKFVKLIINEIKFGIEELIEDEVFGRIKFYWGGLTKKYEFGVCGEKLIN